MTLEEIDKLVGDILYSKYMETVERRDYREIENKSPESFRGYGEKNGIMYLVDLDNDLYIDIFLLKDSFKMVLREDSSKIINLTTSYSLTIPTPKDYLLSFIGLVEEHDDIMIKQWKRYSSFNSGIIPIDLIRGNKIDEIIS